MTEASMSTNLDLRLDVLSAVDNDPDFHLDLPGVTLDVWKLWTRTTAFANRMTKSAYTGFIPLPYQDGTTAVQEVDIGPTSLPFEPVGDINKVVDLTVDGQECKQHP